MNENLNLVEILKDCPKRTKFYSPFLGNCELVEVCDDYVRVRAACINYSINANGTFPFGTFDSEEIMLFPSREQRDWSKWVCPKKPRFDPKTLRPFESVLAASMADGRWTCDYFSHIGKSIANGKTRYVCSGFGAYDRIIPYNEDTKHLVGTTEEAPEFYRYWED